MTNYTIHQLSVDSDGSMQIGFFHRATDLKAPGLVRLSTLIVPTGYEYDDEIQAVIDAINDLLNDVIQDFDALPAAEAQP